MPPAIRISTQPRGRAGGRRARFLHSSKRASGGGSGSSREPHAGWCPVASCAGGSIPPLATINSIVRSKSCSGAHPLVVQYWCGCPIFWSAVRLTETSCQALAELSCCGPETAVCLNRETLRIAAIRYSADVVCWRANACHPEATSRLSIQTEVRRRLRSVGFGSGVSSTGVSGRVPSKCRATRELP